MNRGAICCGLAALGVWLLLAAPAGAESVEVWLLRNRSVRDLQLAAPGWTAIDGTGRSTPADRCRVVLSGRNRGLECRERTLREPPFRLEPAAADPGPPVELTFAGQRRRCPGRLRFEVFAERLRPVLSLELEDYVAGVLAAETTATQPEMLKAMAVCIRSHARETMRQTAGPIADDTRAQVYRGAPDETRAPALAAAARETAGLSLRLGDRPAPAFFHACCGGRTQPAELVWPRLGPQEHLRGVADVDEAGRAWCAGNRWFTWTRTLPADRWRAFLANSFQATGATRAGDDGRVQLLSDSGVRSLGAWLFRLQLGRAVGWNAAPSDRFAIESGESGVVLRGHGFGHRVGLCQAGAAAQADAGRAYQDILRFYFPGTEIR